MVQLCVSTPLQNLVDQAAAFLNFHPHPEQCACLLRYQHLLLAIVDHCEKRYTAISQKIVVTNSTIRLKDENIETTPFFYLTFVTNQ